MAGRRSACRGEGQPELQCAGAVTNSAEVDLRTVQAVMTIQHHWQRYMIQKRLRDAGAANTAVPTGRIAPSPRVEPLAKVKRTV